MGQAESWRGDGTEKVKERKSKFWEDLTDCLEGSVTNKSYESLMVLEDLNLRVEIATQETLEIYRILPVNGRKERLDEFFSEMDACN